jgi:aryl-alcohol dehydrogenase-like predicted oxidoreductase
MVRICGEQGVAFVPFFSIAAHGRDAGVRDERSDAVLTVARSHGVTPAQVRIAWTLHRGPHVLAIPGTGNPDHLTENVAVGTLCLSPDEMSLLDSAHAEAE